MAENPPSFGQPDADPDNVPTEPTMPMDPAAGGPGMDGAATHVGSDEDTAPHNQAPHNQAPHERRGSRDAGSHRSQAADDAAFLDLMSRFDQEPGPDERGWPSAEDVDRPQRPTIIIRPASRRPDGMPPDGRHLPDSDPAERTAPASASEEEDHYLPPTAPPVPKMRPVTRWALGSIALGVAMLVVPLIGLNQSRSQDVAGVLLILGGVGTLVARMGERPPTDSDGPDDGAVV